MDFFIIFYTKWNSSGECIWHKTNLQASGHTILKKKIPIYDIAVHQNEKLVEKDQVSLQPSLTFFL